MQRSPERTARQICIQARYVNATYSWQVKSLATNDANNKTQRSNDEFFFLSGSDRQTLSSVSVSLLPRAQARIAITTDADGSVGGIVDVAAVLFAAVRAVVLAIFIIDSCCCC